MNTQTRVLPKNIYILKEGLSEQELSSAIKRSLCQAEALAIIAAIIDTDAVGSDVINNYLWSLSDIVQEAKWLYDYLMD